MLTMLSVRDGYVKDYTLYAYDLIPDLYSEKHYKTWQSSNETTLRRTSRECDRLCQLDNFVQNMWWLSLSRCRVFNHIF